MSARRRWLRQLVALALAPALSSTGAAAVPGGDFVLSDHHGRRFDSRDLRGRWWLLVFGYTHCPDVCPASLQWMAQVLGALGPLPARRVQPLFITLDPTRDTVERLRDYVPWFGDSLIGLTGSAAAIADVTRRYGVALERRPAAGDHYWLDHTANAYLVGPDGRVASVVPHGFPPRAVVDQLRARLGLDASEPVAQLEHPDRWLARHAGRPRVLHFWASWCAPCRAEFGPLDALAERLGSARERLAAVNVGEREGAIARFLADYPLRLPVLADGDGRSPDRYALSGLPATLFFDPTGREAERITGPLDWAAPALIARLSAFLQVRQ